jgi:uncharacterized delta-60 repeat protein
MKRLSSIALGLAAAGLLAGPALGSPAGDLDPSFDGDGKRSVANPYMANEVLVQPDGKILVVGNGAANDFAVTRLSAEGAIDRGYGNNGTAVADFGEDDRALAAALQPDGKVVLVGESVSMGDTTAVARFDANGKLDAGFDPGGTDGDGKKLLPNGPGDPEAVLVQPDGRIVVAGSRSTGEIVDTEMAVVRLTTTGAVDGTEWDYGRFAARAVTRTAALTPDGKIVLAGELQPDNQPREIELTRFDANGKLDKTFGGTGKATFASDASEEVADVLVQPDGKVVVTGSRSKSGFFEGVVTRVQSDGKPDPTWGRGAQAFVDFESQSFAMAAAREPDGKVVVVGLEAAEVDMAPARFRPDGSLDASFGSGGRSTVPGGFIEAALAVALQDDGRIVMAGQSAAGSPVVRLWADPPPAGGETPSGSPGPAGPATVVRCAGKPATIVGTARGETLRGTPRADVIVALGGNDRVLAGRGRDVVCGGAGRDVLSGGPGRDRLIGGGQRDRCAGGPGRDRAAGCEARRSL